MSYPPGVRATARRELSRMAAQPIYPLLLVVLPLLAFAVLWAIFSSAVPRDLPVAVLDRDHSALSRQLLRLIDASPTMKVALSVASQAEGERLVRQGKVYALVTIPDEFERAIRRGESAPVVCHYNAQLLLLASLIRRDLRGVVGTFSAGIELRRRQGGGTPLVVAMAQMAPVRMDRHTLFNPELSYLVYLLPALLPTVLQVFILVLAVQALGCELKEGSAAQWLATAGGSVRKAVIGKLLPATVHFCLMGLAMLVILFQSLAVPLRGSLTAIIVGTLLFVLAVKAVGIALVAWLANLRFATSAAAFLAGPALAFSGITFPVAAMPLPAQAWGALIPLTHFLRVLVDQAMRGAPVAVSAVPLAALATFVLVLPAVSFSRLRRVATDERFWGRL